MKQLPQPCSSVITAAQRALGRQPGPVGTSNTERRRDEVSIIDREQYFTSLPQRYYVSTEQFSLDIEKIWRRQWLYAGHVSQVPAPGDYFTFEFLNESL